MVRSVNYQGKHVLVLGLGESGLAMALWLTRCGASLRVADTREAPARLPQLMEAVAAEFIAGAFTASLLDGVDFVAVSPGLAPDRELAEIIPAALERNIPLWGEIELFAQALAALRGNDTEEASSNGEGASQAPAAEAGPAAAVADDVTDDATEAELADEVSNADSAGIAEETEVATNLSGEDADGSAAMATLAAIAADPVAPKAESGYRPKVIAITGTNGKTTVTSLTGLLCRRAGLKTQIAGNISPAALDVLRIALDSGDLPQVWVLELSSFQLHFTHSLQADVATVLNVTQDHLDWHGTMDAYAADKARIFGANTIRVLNRDDAHVMKMASPAAPCISFGARAPEQADCFGLAEDNGMHWLSMAVASEEGEKRRRKKEAVEVPVTVKRLMPADALKIRGQHNAVNALAALALCRAIGLNLAPLLHGLRDYKGEPHRVELIASVGGVDYYDDSKGTNVGATVAALNGLGVMQGGRLVLIAGGDGKGQDFSPLAEPVAKFVRAVVLIGKDGPAVRAAIASAGTDMIDCATLEEAVERAADLARAGDAVLLSPACASLDMFRNYAHRAEVFADAVRELALSRGEVIA
jgi:UDP-N-acetylmuramoylalanine--D-glutamate ligase